MWGDICYDGYMDIFFLFASLFLSLGCIYFLIRTRRLTQERNTFKKELNQLEAMLDKTKQAQSQAMEETKRKQQFDSIAAPVLFQLDEGILCIDHGGTVVYMNAFAQKYLNASNIGKSYKEVLDSLKIGGIKDFSLFEEALRGQYQVLPDASELTGKETIPLRARLLPFSTDEYGQLVAFVFADNTPYIENLTEERTFFSSAAHELRTPLTVIRMATSMLSTGLETLSREKIFDYLKKIDVTSSQLANLINDFLNVSRIQQGRLVLEKHPFDIVSLTDEVVHELSDLARERNLYLHHEVTGGARTVIGDKNKAKEVLTNLIGNGIKYTIRGGITIAHLEQAGMLATKISDTGTGIPAIAQPLLFRRFMQVGGARQLSTAKSSGLGLYISKKFAILMGGDVRLETSEPGRGSTFIFSLPQG